MYKENEIEIIGIDHGFKNIKTRNCMFSTSISQLDVEPDDTTDVLEFKGKFYTIFGDKVSSVENRDKSNSEEFYLLTLVALAKELSFRKKMPKAVTIVAGLPFKWYDQQKASFKESLEAEKTLEFKFEGKEYKLELDTVKVYRQGLSAIAPYSRMYNNGYYILVDIGGGTIDIVPIENMKALRNESKISTRATIHLMTEIKEKIETTFFNTVRESEIINTIVKGRYETKDEYEVLIQSELAKFTKDVFRELKEFGFNVGRENIIFIGGGASIIEKFGEYDPEKTFFVSDMHANAKGYEYTENMIRLAKAK